MDVVVVCSWLEEDKTNRPVKTNNNEINDTFRFYWTSCNSHSSSSQLFCRVKRERKSNKTKRLLYHRQVSISYGETAANKCWDRLYIDLSSSSCSSSSHGSSSHTVSGRIISSLVSSVGAVERVGLAILRPFIFVLFFKTRDLVDITSGGIVKGLYLECFGEEKKKEENKEKNNKIGELSLESSWLVVATIHALHCRMRLLSRNPSL